MLSNNIANSPFTKLNASFKFIFFCLSIVLIFLPGGIFNQLIIAIILIPMLFIAKINKKTILNILKTFFLMFALFLLINWFSIKSPDAIYATNANYLISNGWINNNFLYNNSFYLDQNIYISNIYGGSIAGQVNDGMIQAFISKSEVTNWFNRFDSNTQNRLLQLALENNSTLITSNEEAKALLYLLNNNFSYNGVEYTIQFVKNSPFISENKIAYKDIASILYIENWYSFSPIAIARSLYISLKVVLIIISSTLLVSTTSSIELTNGLEKILSPLKLIKFPASECALILSIGIRFIPSLLSESKRIINAQAARGLDFYNGNLWIKIKSLVALIVPLFSISIKKSDDLANAMDARGYVPKQDRTIYRVSNSNLWDYFYLSIIFLLGSYLIANNVVHFFFSPFGILELGLL